MVVMFYISTYSVGIHVLYLHGYGGNVLYQYIKCWNSRFGSQFSAPSFIQNVSESKLLCKSTQLAYLSSNNGNQS